LKDILNGLIDNIDKFFPIRAQEDKRKTEQEVMVEDVSDEVYEKRDKQFDSILGKMMYNTYGFFTAIGEVSDGKVVKLTTNSATRDKGLGVDITKGSWERLDFVQGEIIVKSGKGNPVSGFRLPKKGFILVDSKAKEDGMFEVAKCKTPPGWVILRKLEKFYLKNGQDSKGADRAGTYNPFDALANWGK
jgi:hypothetical protein